MEEAKGRRWAGSGEYTSGSEGMYTEVEEAFFSETYDLISSVLS